MEIERQLHNIAGVYLGSRRVLVLLGPRGAGKTHLLKQWADERQEDALFLNGEDLRVKDLLDPKNSSKFMALLGRCRFFILDEAWKIPDIALTVTKLLNHAESLMVILSGSSGGDNLLLSNDPLRGLKYTFHLFPLCEAEYQAFPDSGIPPPSLNQKLIYGNFPAVTGCQSNEEKENYLRGLLNEYFYQDIPAAVGVGVSEKIRKLLLIIAQRTGEEISLNELGRLLSISKNTAGKYLQVLSRLYIIHPVSPLSAPGKRLLSKQLKWYFYDNGIRNILLSDMRMPENRDDAVMLYENYLISERIKQQRYQRRAVTNYFMRTYDGLKINWIEESAGRLTGYRFCMDDQKRKVPAVWTKALPQGSFKVINTKNYKEWLLE